MQRMLTENVQTASDGSGALTGSDSPAVGESIDEYTHYGHVRYASSDEPGVIWYDPRDGRERFWFDLGVTLEDFEDTDDRILRGVSIHPFRPATDSSGRYIVFQHKSYVEILRRYEVDEWIETERVASCRESDVFDSLEDAREWCREHVAGYADAPRRDAVANRL